MTMAIRPIELLPAVTVLPFAIISAMPWSAPDWVAFALPLVTLTAIHLWAEHRPGLMPAPVVLLIGVLVDLITDGPLGFWAVLYLLALAIGAHSHAGVAANAASARQLATWRRYLSMLGIVIATAWFIGCLYYFQIFNPSPMLAGAALMVALKPVVDFLLEPMLRLTAERRDTAALRAGGA